MSLFIGKEQLNRAFQLWLRHWKTEKGLTNLQIAVRTGASPATIGFLLNGDRHVSETKMREMAHAAGFDLGEILRPYLPGLDRPGGLAVRPEAGRQEPVARNGGPPPAQPADWPGLLAVPFSGPLRLGPDGRSLKPADSRESESRLLLDGRALGLVTAEGLRAVRARGRAMEPFIPDGGIVLIDMKDNDLRRLREGSVYWLCLDLSGGECDFGRLFWARGHEGRWLSVQSGASFFEGQVRAAEEIALLGRVIGAWRNFGAE
ncbi:MAG: hypothetical protein LBP33_05725 [Candidatus Adiutrix sp.]|jgi:transcriptional regulator with XRE-family HTH domain|nr:hypothetical protein [Candidatus Adiutrix sp.]